MTLKIEKSRRCNRPADGFTLIELLVVISIIALLVSILLPSLGKARDLAAKAGCMATLGGIGKGWLIYRDNNNEDIPYTDSDGNMIEAIPPLLSDNSSEYTIMDAMEEVIPRANWKCPSKVGTQIFEEYGNSYEYLIIDFVTFALVGLDDQEAKNTIIKLANSSAQTVPVFTDMLDDSKFQAHPTNINIKESGVTMYWDTHIEFVEGDPATREALVQVFIDLVNAGQNISEE